MRLAGQEKMGYYPTPAILLDVIASYLKPAESDADRARALDPCCGMGEALSHVAAKINALETWGAELSPDRSREAERVLTKVHHCAWQSCRVGRGSVSLLWLNPPYDLDALTNTRLEQQFLEDALPALCAGGVLVYIIPQNQLGNPGIARRLAATLERLTIVRFPDAEYAAYKQVVVFGVKKRSYASPSQNAVDAVTRFAALPPEHTPVLAAQAQPIYAAPPASAHDLDGRTPRFRRLHWQSEDLIATAQAQGVRAKSKAWRDAMNAAHAEVVVQPAMPLKKGHIAMLMAAGLMGVMTLERTSDESGPLTGHGAPERIVAKGRVIKTQETHTEDVYGTGGKVVATKTVSKDVFVTSVATLDSRGNLEVIKDEAGLARFMQAFGEQLAQQVIAKHKPEYDLKPTDAEWRTVNSIALSMRLPGRREGGLLNAQKHVAIASARVMRKRRCAVINAEMGFGKTATSCAVLELLDAYPAVVLCPPHLVRKWAAEIERAVPGAVAKIVNCVERGEDDESFERSNVTRAHVATSNVDTCERANVPTARYSIMDFVRDWRAGRLGKKAVAVISRERAKLGSGWAPVAITRNVYSKDEGQWVEYLADPDTGQLLLDDQEAILRADPAAWKFLAAKQCFSRTEPVKGWELTDGEGEDENSNKNKKTKGNAPRRSGKWGRRQVRTALFTQGQGTGSLCNLPTLDADGRLVRPPQVACPENRVGFRRTPIAAFIHRKLKHFFKLLIADELHQYKAATTDQAIAMHQISRACKWTLGLTGTLFGGKSTSLLHLAHRASHEVREEFGVDDERRWAQLFGVLETTRWDGKDAKADGDEAGAFSGYERDRVIVRELPGISPAIVRYLLPHVVFARIADLGYELPPYSETVVRLDMSAAQRQQYWEDVYDPRGGQAGGRLYKLMLDALKEGDNSLLSVWLQTALARPNAAYRCDDVQQLSKRAPPIASGAAESDAHETDLAIASQRRKLLKKSTDRAQLMQLPAITNAGEWLSKERWLMDYCRDQALQGRRVLIYCRQTGTRDIQPRLAEALKHAGLRSKVLRPSIAPERREAWMQANVADINDLITNPKLVETGLDLIMFHSVVFYEIEYSLCAPHGGMN